MNEFTFGAKALRFLGLGGYGTVSPGDDLWAAIRGSGDDTPLGTRELANHWAVRSAVGVVSRGLHSVECVTARRVEDGWIPIADQRASDLLAPHIKRIAADIVRWGEFVAVMAVDGRDTPRQLIPLRPDELSIAYEGGKPVRYELGAQSWAPSKILHIAEELPASSPLEGIRDVLLEDVEASKWRIDAWKSSPRGLVRRPLDAPTWSSTARERFQGGFNAQMRKRGSEVPMLEDNMEWLKMDLPDAGAMQFAEARRLCVDIVADVVGIQSSLLATGADRTLSEAQRQLLQGPVSDIAKLIQHAFAEQLAGRMYGTHGQSINVYFDVPLALRLVQEDPAHTNNAVGTPWRTVAEQRELEGLPPLDGTSTLARPETKNVVTR